MERQLPSRSLGSEEWNIRSYLREKAVGAVAEIFRAFSAPWEHSPGAAFNCRGRGHFPLSSKGTAIMHDGPHGCLAFGGAGAHTTGSRGRPGGPL